jgi:ubiquinone/menaquinone biosynthesis C-methylase UbiE
MDAEDDARVDAKGIDSSAVRAYFDSEALEYVRERERQYSFMCQKRLVLEMLDGARGRLLDLGCGPAVMEEAFAARGFTVRGVDASQSMIEHGKARLAERGLGERCSLAVGDVTRLGGADGFYDAVVAMGLLEYLPDYRPALQEMHRVMRPGGILVLTVPNRFAPYHAARRTYHRLRSVLGRPRHEALAANLCVPRTLDRLLEQQGFRTLERHGCNFIFFPLHDKLPAASDRVNRALWPLARTPLGTLFGAQYVVKARKR